MPSDLETAGRVVFSQFGLALAGHVNVDEFDSAQVRPWNIDRLLLVWLYRLYLCVASEPKVKAAGLKVGFMKKDSSTASSIQRRGSTPKAAEKESPKN